MFLYDLDLRFLALQNSLFFGTRVPRFLEEIGRGVYHVLWLTTI